MALHKSLLLFAGSISKLQCKVYSRITTIKMQENTESPYIPNKYVQLTNPEWIKSAVLYELNIRQFSAEGSFKAVEKQLPRLKELGIDIIWLMPVHPIGEINRKGSLGSYYSVQDFEGINPEFGTESDFQDLVNAIHDNGLYVILDWVANHSSWDNQLTETNPEYYKRTSDGKFQSTKWRDYDDIIEFDYGNPDLRKYMTDAMKYWVEKFDIDGFRCDVASFVPIDFWENARKELEAIKPVFMLAEAEDRDLHRKAFDASYNWTLWNILHEIAAGRKNARFLAESYLAEHVSTFPKDGIRLNFIDNHDKNSWEGTPKENFGEALECMTVFTFLMDGMPLIYNGQEAGLNRALKFFDRDPIDWKPHQDEQLFEKIFELKHQNQALWNAKWGGEMVRIENNQMENILSFVRAKNGDRVIGVFNFSDMEIEVTCFLEEHAGAYNNFFLGSTTTVTPHAKFQLAAWGFLVFHN